MSDDFVAPVHRPEHIVVGIDGSLPSRAAVRWAIGHARDTDVVDLVHVWRRTMADSGGDPPDDALSARRFAQRELAHARALRHDPKVEIRASAVEGDPCERLCEFPADLLVIGTRGGRGVTGVMLDSVARRLARRRHHHPLVIVPLAGEGGKADGPE